MYEEIPGEASRPVILFSFVSLSIMSCCLPSKQLF